MNITNFAGITSMSSYTKNIGNNLKWQERKQTLLNTSSGVGAGIPAKKFNEPMTQKEQIIADIRKINEDQQRGNNISAIESKLMSGKKLSGVDLEYLKEHAPELYEKAIKIMRERAEYERELSRAKSKEDVDKIHQRKMQQFVAEARAVAKSSMSAADKIDAMKTIQMRMFAILDEHLDFMQSEDYQKLPDKSDDGKLPDKTSYLSDDTVDDPVQYLESLFADFSVPVSENAEIRESVPVSAGANKPVPAEAEKSEFDLRI